MSEHESASTSTAEQADAELYSSGGILAGAGEISVTEGDVEIILH